MSTMMRVSGNGAWHFDVDLEQRRVTLVVKLIPGNPLADIRAQFDVGSFVELASDVAEVLLHLGAAPNREQRRTKH